MVEGKKKKGKKLLIHLLTLGMVNFGRKKFLEKWLGWIALAWI